MDHVEQQPASNGDATGKLPGGITGKGWRPGVSGNPKGRKPGPSLTATLRELLDELVPGTDKTKAELLCRVLIKIALKGDRQAIADIFNRCDGRVREAEEAPPEAGGEPIDWRAILETRLGPFLEDPPRPEQAT